MPISTTYTSHELNAHKGELAIYGQIFLPAGADETHALPTLVCAHGFGANYLQTVNYAWAMAEAGWAAVCFDFCGGGYAARSEGNPLEMTLETEKDDLATVIDHVSKLPFVDEDDLHVLGDGQGAVVATLFAHERPDDIKSLFLIHPNYCLAEQTRKLFPTKKNIPASYRHLGMRVGRAFGEVIWDLNPYAIMHNYKNDVLIITGSDDTSVPLDSLRRAEEAFPQAQLMLINGARQTIRGPQLEQAIEACVDFLTHEAAF